MTDVLGWRKTFGVLAPSTNTVVQPDYEVMRPIGITNHYRHIYVEDPTALCDEDFVAGTMKISEGVKDALRAAVTFKPDYLVLGISAISFWGGRAGCDQMVRDMQELTGRDISVGSRSLAEALKVYSAKRVAFVSPYYPSANATVRAFLADYDIETVRDVPLECQSWTDIAKVDEARLIRTLRDLDGDDIDAICQVGTNLSMARLAGEAEKWLGKPVVAINTATYWHALRTNGIQDKVDGLGSLLRDY